MRIEELMASCAGTPEGRMRAIFNALFTICNRLQALFDSRIPDVTLRQFMLLSALRQAGRPLTLTQLGGLLGCSRQNARKVADALARGGYVELTRSADDARALCAALTAQAQRFFEREAARCCAELDALFASYTEPELAELFRLTVKLCTGVDALEARGERLAPAPKEKEAPDDERNSVI